MLTVADASSTRRVLMRERKAKKGKRLPKSVNVDKIVGFIHKTTPRYCDLWLALVVVGLAIFGILMIYSASNYNAQVYYDDPIYYTVKQLIGLVLGIVGLIIMYFIIVFLFRYNNNFTIRFFTFTISSYPFIIL